MVVTGCITAQTSQRSRKTDHRKVRNACGSARGHTVRGRFGAPHQQASLAHPPRPPSVPPSCIMHRVGGTNPQAALPATTWTPSHSADRGGADVPCLHCGRTHQHPLSAADALHHRHSCTGGPHGLQGSRLGQAQEGRARSPWLWKCQEAEACKIRLDDRAGEAGVTGRT